MYERLNRDSWEALDRISRKWIDRFYNNPDPLVLDPFVVREFVDWIYSISGLTSPDVLIADSPVHAQELANEFCLRNNIEHTKRYFQPSETIGVSNYAFMAYNEYMRSIGLDRNKNLDDYQRFYDLNIYEAIQLEEVCVITRMPKYVRSVVRDGVHVLHCSEGPAIEFIDGFSVYFLDGLQVSRKELFPEMFTHETCKLIVNNTNNSINESNKQYE